MNDERGYQIGELDAADTDAMLRLRNGIFGPISREHWDAMGCTAAVAKKDAKFVGTIPLQFRHQVMDRRASIPVVYENAVGVDESVRGTGIGTAILDAAAGFMADRVDAFFVYRTGERTAGYRFYRKTHHGDLYFLDTLSLAKPRGADNDVAVLPWDESIGLEAKLLPIFRHNYGGYGGYWKREKGFFAQVVSSHVYKNDDCLLMVARRSGRVSGYAIINPGSRIWGGFCIYDIASRSVPVLKKLLAKIEFMARKFDMPVTMPANPEHPLFGPLMRRGYELKGNTPYIMARIIRPERIFARLAEGSAVLTKLHLEAATPHRDVSLNAPKKPRAAATLYLKESQLSRLLSCRLHFQTALRTNEIRMTPLEPQWVRALGRVFRFAPWVSFGMDYV